MAGPAATERVNLTAPHTRICKGKRGRDWIQGDDLVITVGARQIILAGQLTDTGTDQGALHPSLHTARTNCDTAGIHDRMRAHLADAGFASEATFATPTEGILLVSTTAEATHTQTPTSTTDQTPITPGPNWHAMRQRTTNPAGKNLYRHRPAMVEPAFAQLFNPGGRRLHLRGPTRHTEITLMIASHNAGKYLHSDPRTRHQHPPPATLLTTHTNNP